MKVKCPSCGQAIKVRKDGTMSFHRVPVKVRSQFGKNAILGAYCALSRCSYRLLTEIATDLAFIEGYDFKACDSETQESYLWWAERIHTKTASIITGKIHKDLVALQLDSGNVYEQSRRLEEYVSSMLSRILGGK